jgi:hypothetical protein
MKTRVNALAIVLAVVGSASFAAAQDSPRARDLGIPFEGTPGPLNSITDVKGVEVGYRTLISGEGKLQVGVGPVRTGVTAIFPRGKSAVDPVFAGWFTENGNGEMTGTTWVEESGFLYGPVMITNTHSVGVVRDTVIDWQLKHGTPIPLEDWWSLPVVAETSDGDLNDINGFHVKPEDAIAAMQDAHSGTDRRRQRRRWHRHDLFRIQRRHRHIFPQAPGKSRRLYGRRAGSMQFWRATLASYRRCPGRI